MAADTKAVEQAQAMDEKYVLERYKNQIDYYWKTSSSNKKAYKRSRTWTIILGALVTLAFAWYQGCLKMECVIE